MRIAILFPLYGVLLSVASAFTPAVVSTNKSNRPRAATSRTSTVTSSNLAASVIPQSPEELLLENINGNFRLSADEVNSVVKLGKEPKQKVINPFGLWCMAVSLVICPIWYLALQFTAATYKMSDAWDPNREFYDGLGKIWAKVFLTLIDSYPTFSGELKLLQKGPHNKPCLFVANHASWLDIPVLCTCTDQVFKFIAKGELGKLPCIGDQLSGVSILVLIYLKYHVGVKIC